MGVALDISGKCNLRVKSLFSSLIRKLFETDRQFQKTTTAQNKGFGVKFQLTSKAHSCTKSPHVILEKVKEGFKKPGSLNNQVFVYLFVCLLFLLLFSIFFFWYSWWIVQLVCQVVLILNSRKIILSPHLSPFLNSFINQTVNLKSIPLFLSII